MNATYDKTIAVLMNDQPWPDPAVLYGHAAADGVGLRVSCRLTVGQLAMSRGPVRKCLTRAREVQVLISILLVQTGA